MQRPDAIVALCLVTWRVTALLARVRSFALAGTARLRSWIDGREDARALRAALEASGQGLLHLADNGRVTAINDRARALLGVPPARFRPRLTAADLAGGQRGVLADLPALLADAGRPDWREERGCADGAVLALTLRRPAAGGAVLAVTDVTAEREQARRLAEATEAATRARTEFLGMMSHEVRTPMNGVIGVCGLLLDLPLDPLARQYAGMVRDAGEHLLWLIDEVLDFAKLDAGRLQLTESRFELRAMAHGAVERMASRAQAKGLSLGLELAPELPRFARGDSGRLREVLLHLIDNAIKFTASGSVTVRLTPGAPAAAEPGVLRLECTVSDTGIGIAPEQTGKLFRHFSQLDSSASRQFGGAGLGLAICRKLVELMGGGIGVQSEPGAGSTFRFQVRLGAEPDEAREAPAGGACRVLVADDNNTNRLVVARMLERRGHRVDGVANGREAVAAVQAVAYDVVLMDVMMPEMDGLDATRAIRALPGPASRIKLIGLTANALTADRDACLAAGMDRFLTKPVTAETLSRTIAETLAAG